MKYILGTNLNQIRLKLSYLIPWDMVSYMITHTGLILGLRPANDRRRYKTLISWWRHQMETFSALLAMCAGNSPVPGEFAAQRPVTRSFDVFFVLRLN